MMGPFGKRRDMNQFDPLVKHCGRRKKRRKTKLDVSKHMKEQLKSIRSNVD
jgi:hypothetical protein